MRGRALALLVTLNASIVGLAVLFRQTVVPGWKKGPLIDPASPYAPENAMVLFAVAACLFVDVYLLGVARTRRRWLMLAVAAVVAELGVRAWLAVDMVTYFRPHPTLHWVVRPNLDAFDNLKGGGTITTNADGLREVKVPRAKAPGEYRVLVLGDSSNFGHGVEGDEMWSSVLAARVPRLTVLNGACPGWTTFQAVEFLRTTGMAYEPDLVVAGFNNDPGPEYLPDRARVMSGPVRALNGVLFRAETYLLTREVLLSLVRRAAGEGTERKAGDEPLYGKLSDAEAKGLVPRVPLAEFLDNLRQLDTVAPDFVWLNMPVNRTEAELVARYVNPDYRAEAARLGVRVVDVDDRWLRTRERDLFQKGHVFHPNAQGHARIAEQVANEVFDATVPVGGPPPAKTEATLRFGISSLTPVHAHVAAVLEARPELAAEHRLVLELHDYVSGKGQGEDVASGLLDAFFSCEVPAVKMLEGRTDVRVVATPGALGRIAVVGRVASLGQVARIGLSQGSTPAMDWQWWGRQHRAQVVDLKTEEQLAALREGRVDAVAAWDPWVADWLEKEPYTVLAERTFRSVLAVSAPWSTFEAGRARRLVELVEHALRIAASDRPRWDAAVAAKTGWPLTVVKAVADQNDVLAGRAGNLTLTQLDVDGLDRAARYATNGRIASSALVATELLEGRWPARTGGVPPAPAR